MRMLPICMAVTGIGLQLLGPAQEFQPAPPGVPRVVNAAHAAHARVAAPGPDRLGDQELTEVIERYCVTCHNDQRLTGNLSLEDFRVDGAAARAETAEKMIVKLRAGMMPPSGRRRPAGDTLLLLVENLEATLDEAAEQNRNPGIRSFQRLNREEYEASIRDLLGLEIDAGAYLPLDTKSANFDNIADVQMLSPMLLGAYLTAASEISRLAVGDASVLPSETNYAKEGYYSQWERSDGAPYGTRGGVSALHNFPADGLYLIKMAFDHTTTGGFYGNIAQGEQIEISIDGARVALIEVDQFMHQQDPNAVNMESEPFPVRAGPHQVSAVFLQRFEGPIVDLMSPFDWSLADRRIGADGYGITALPHMKDMSISGPFDVTGISDTPTRQRIFSCRPTSSSEAPGCAREIVERLATRAYRRLTTEQEVGELMLFYQRGADDGGFENGVRMALQAILASPAFVFRFEPADGDIRRPGESYRISDAALASRLSFFLWGGPPDTELIALAGRNELSNPVTLEVQVDRMLADPRAEALGTRFSAQWLRLGDLDKLHPDRLLFPDFHQQLADAMRRETELFFYSLVREDRSIFDLYTADYTFVNERLAKHYGIPGIIGEKFRRVDYPNARRAGILGHGSVLTLTSVANRTSPVLRGKWVMEVLLGTPPPPPPPGVPDLDETSATVGNSTRTTRERMEEHRSNPACNSCHRLIDPIGLALDNFDVTGQWRVRENGVLLDTRGEFYDGTPLDNPQDLRKALLKRPEVLVRNFTANLMAYALGRWVEYYDMPDVRAIVADAGANGFRVSAFVKGIVRTDAFQMKRAPSGPGDVP